MVPRFAWLEGRGLCLAPYNQCCKGISSPICCDSRVESRCFRRTVDLLYGGGGSSIWYFGDCFHHAPEKCFASSFLLTYCGHSKAASIPYCLFHCHVALPPSLPFLREYIGYVVKNYNFVGNDSLSAVVYSVYDSGRPKPLCFPRYISTFSVMLFYDASCSLFFLCTQRGLIS